MIKVFNSPFKITQEFGVNKDYYKQFGLAGHEGLDLVPTGSDWSVFSLPYKGQVVRDIDMASKGGAYGITCTVWYPEKGEAWQYCHLSSNMVYEGQEIAPGTQLGVMGSTGNSTGAHLHLNRFKVDARGYRQNKDNGFLGGINPLPFLQQDLTPPAPVPTPTVPINVITVEQAIRDAYQGLTGQQPSDDELNYRLSQNKPLREIIDEICSADQRFKDKWLVCPTPSLADYSAWELLTEAMKKLKP